MTSIKKALMRLSKHAYFPSADTNNILFNNPEWGAGSTYTATLPCFAFLYANNNRESSHAIIYLNGKQICEGYGTNSSSTDRSVVSLKKGDKLTSRAGNYLYGPVVCGISWTSIDVGGVLQRLINFCTLSWKGGVA